MSAYGPAHTLGGILLIIRRSLRQHAVATCITAAATALACGLVMAVFSINRQASDAFTSGATGFDAVLGGRGSPLQLVLSSVFQLETSPGNIPYKMYEDIRKNPNVSLAIPLTVGDNYRGFRIVGTAPEFFTQYTYGRGRKLEVQPGGQAWTEFKRDHWEAVVGSYVARQTGLTIGSVFNSYHGLTYDPKNMHPDQYTVVGILEPTGTPVDQVIWVPLDSYYLMTGHGHAEELKATGATIPDEYKELSAVMLKFKSPGYAFQLSMQVNRQGKVATLAYPIGAVMTELFQKLGWAHRVLSLVAYLVVAVAAGSILASIYNTMNERRREFAILRALGAGRLTVSAAIVGEAAAIAALGAVAGLAVYAALVAVAATVIRANTGVVLDAWRFDGVLVIAPAVMVGLGAAAGLVPAMKAYSTDVAANLTPAT